MRLPWSEGISAQVRQAQERARRGPTLRERRAARNRVVSAMMGQLPSAPAGPDAPGAMAASA